MGRTRTGSCDPHPPTPLSRFAGEGGFLPSSPGPPPGGDPAARGEKGRSPRIVVAPARGQTRDLPLQIARRPPKFVGAVPPWPPSGAYAPCMLRFDGRRSILTAVH